MSRESKWHTVTRTQKLLNLSAAQGHKVDLEGSQYLISSEARSEPGGQSISYQLRGSK